jgi:hypothetical protein
MKLELVSIAGEKDKDKAEDDPDAERKKRKGTRKGDEVIKGCVLKVDIELHELVAKVRVTEPDAKEPSEGEAKLRVLEAGGSWFLVMAPKLSAGGGSIGAGLRKYRDKMCACKDVKCTEDVSEDMEDWARTMRDEIKSLPGDERKALDEIDDEMKACRRKLREGDEAAEAKDMMAKLEEFRARMCACADRTCAEQIEKDTMDWSTSVSSKARKPRDDDQKKAVELMIAYEDCKRRAMKAEAAPRPPDDPPPPDDPASSGGSSLASLPACAEYRRGIDKLLGCPKYPRSAAEAMKQDYERRDKAWASSSQTQVGRDLVNKSCAESAELLKKLLDSMCP